jgi:hypothetical protein
MRLVPRNPRVSWVVAALPWIVAAHGSVTGAADTPTGSALPDPVARAARRLILENAVCAADLERELAVVLKGRSGRFDGTTLFHRRQRRDQAEAELVRARKALEKEFPEPFDLARCGTRVQAARVLSRKPIPAPDSPANAREWASVMAEPTVAALLCLRRRAPAGEGRSPEHAATTEAVEAVYERRFGRAFRSLAKERCGEPDSPSP